MSKLKSQRKFRCYISDGRIICDNCGRKIENEEVYFERNDLYERRPLSGGGSNVFGFDSYIKVYEHTTLCKDCVPKDEVVKKCQKFVNSQRR